MASGFGGGISFQKMGMGDCCLLLACFMYVPCDAQQRYFAFALRWLKSRRKKGIEE
jgi:hypothetical protein